MRTLFYVMSTLAVLGLAVWAYRQNYATQAELRHVRDLQGEIASLREEMNVLNAEWAYLNRPDRLRALAEMNYDRLGLLPLRAEDFGRVDQVLYPQEMPEPVERSVEVMSKLRGIR